jgi:hypothetical protein
LAITGKEIHVFEKHLKLCFREIILAIKLFFGFIVNYFESANVCSKLTRHMQASILKITVSLPLSPMKNNKKEQTHTHILIFPTFFHRSYV